MPTPIPGFSTSAAGAEAPLEMLSTCHERAGRQCATLKRLVPHLAANGTDEQARSAANNVMRYFDVSARDHHADEEQDLFPALLEAMAGSDAVCIREMTDALTKDHRVHEVMWQGLREVLVRVAAGELALLDAAQVEAFTTEYARHIEREESELLPMAARLLCDADLEKLARAMQARRGGPKS